MKKGHGRGLLLALIVLGIVAIGGFAYTRMSDKATLKDIISAATAPTAVGTATSTAMRFEIVDTAPKQELGLGNRASIADDYGMLFVFKDKQRYGFWMKDMLAPIDIIWLSDNGTILLVDHSVQPDTYPHVFYPPIPVKYVLETRAGYAADHGWGVDTKVPLPAPYGS